MVLTEADTLVVAGADTVIPAPILLQEAAAAGTGTPDTDMSVVDTVQHIHPTHQDAKQGTVAHTATAEVMAAAMVATATATADMMNSGGPWMNAIGATSPVTVTTTEEEQATGITSTATAANLPAVEESLIFGATQYLPRARTTAVVATRDRTRL